MPTVTSTRPRRSRSTIRSPAVEPHLSLPVSAGDAGRFRSIIVDVELRRPHSRLRARASTSRSPGAAPAQTSDCGSHIAGPRSQAHLHGSRTTLVETRRPDHRRARSSTHQRAARRPSPRPPTSSICAQRHAQLKPSSAHDRCRALDARPRRDSNQAGPDARPRSSPSADDALARPLPTSSRSATRPDAERLQSLAALASPGVEGTYVQAPHDSSPEEDHST